MSLIQVKSGNGFYFVNVYFDDQSGKEEKLTGPDGTFRLCKEGKGMIDQIYTDCTGTQKFCFYFYILKIAKKLNRKELSTTDPGFIHFLQWKCQIYSYGSEEFPMRFELDKIDILTEKEYNDLQLVMI